MSSEAHNGEKPQQNLGFAEMKVLFDEGVVGTIEFREWLSRFDEAFARVRDQDIDNEIIEAAQARLAHLRRQNQQPE